MTVIHNLQSNNLLYKTGVRHYSSLPSSVGKIGVEVATDLTSKESNLTEKVALSDVNAENYYDDVYSMKQQILRENKNKSGIYKFTNKLSGSFYIGSSSNLRTRLYSYFQLSNLIRSSSSSIISRALIKYGYSNFSLEILEYCDVSILLEREQYYIDHLKPNYNIAKIAGSTLGIPRTEEFKENLRQIRKGKVHTEETKLLMSMNRSGVNNPMYGKKHSEQSKDLIRISKLGRVVDAKTRLLMSTSHGTPVFLYALCSECSIEKYCLVKQFNSFRDAGLYLHTSHSSISRFVKLGKTFSRKDGKYKLTLSLLEN